MVKRLHQKRLINAPRKVKNAVFDDKKVKNALLQTLKSLKEDEKYSTNKTQHNSAEKSVERSSESAEDYGVSPSSARAQASSNTSNLIKSISLNSEINEKPLKIQNIEKSITSSLKIDQKQKGIFEGHKLTKTSSNTEFRFSKVSRTKLGERASQSPGIPHAASTKASIFLEMNRNKLKQPRMFRNKVSKIISFGPAKDNAGLCSFPLKSALFKAQKGPSTTDYLSETGSSFRNSSKKTYTKENEKSYETQTNSDLFTDSIKQKIYHLANHQCNKDLFQKVNILRYRENVFSAASKLAKEMPPYPDWIYQDEEMQYLEMTKINVGGKIFCILDDTLTNLENTKLSTCIKNHKSPGIPFFDRDPICFAAVIQFYRTGRLHVPPNICLSLFNEELEFWGINEKFMEPCCWSYYNNFKNATNNLKKYCEDVSKIERFKDMPDTVVKKWRQKIYIMMTAGSGSIMSRWLSLISTLFIIISVTSIIISPSPIARVEDGSDDPVSYRENELVGDFLRRTDMSPALSQIELMITGYFLSEFLLRLILCPYKLEFFCDTLNWIDLIAVSTSLTSSRAIWPKFEGDLEGYFLILKLPRILRLFKLTRKLRIGMKAFILTLRASSNELKLIFLTLFVATTVFGCLLFVVEMINDTETKRSDIRTVYLGLWLALITMSTVGYGDVGIKSIPGYLLGSICIMFGVVMCQLPVPIFLQNFNVYYNHASARLNHQFKITVKNVEPNAINDARLVKRESKDKNKGKIFTKLFNTINSNV